MVDRYIVLDKGLVIVNKSADLFPLQIAFQALTDSMFNCNQ